MVNYRIMPEPKFIEQYKRMKRWHERFKVIDQGKPHNTSSDAYQDDVLAFFMNCWHLKDWVTHDTSSDVGESTMKEFIRENYYLKFCDDLCNGNKHLNLDKPKVGKKGARIGSAEIHLFLEEGSHPQAPKINIKYKISGGDEPFDAFEIATNAVKAWDDFLSNNSQYYRENIKTDDVY